MPAVDSKGLTASKVNKNDEWYTRFEDIAAELPRYKEQMREMRVICPCDWDESLDEAIVYASEEYVAGHDLFSPGGTVKVIDADATDKKVMADINAVKCNFVKFLITHAEDYGIETVAVSGYNPASGGVFDSKTLITRSTIWSSPTRRFPSSASSSTRCSPTT